MSDALREQQMAFAAHLRDPANNAAPEGIEDRRLKIYRDLFFNNIHGLLSSNFPVLRKTLGEDAWRALVRDYFAKPRARTPLFTEVGYDFVDWLSMTPRRWVTELANHEYAELALSIFDAPLPPHDPAGDLLDGVPVDSPLAWAFNYTWPVHRIGPDYQPDAPPEERTLLVISRDPAGDVRFSTLSPLAFRLFDLIEANRTETGRTLLQTLATEAAAPDREAFVRDGASMLQSFRRDHVLLGTVPRC